jgi:hypothetical protein
VVVEAGQQLGQLLVEARNLVGGPVLQIADVDLEQDDRHAGPDIRPAIDGSVADFERHGINSGDRDRRLSGQRCELHSYYGGYWAMGDG